MIKRTATVNWYGNLKDGKGQISTESGALNKIPYQYVNRFENEKGANPEELIAAAHAACFSMALSNELQKINLIADSIKVQATVGLNKTLHSDWEISQVHLLAEGIVLGCSQQQFADAAEMAKLGCPVSRLLRADITLEAKLQDLPIEAFSFGL